MEFSVELTTRCTIPTCKCPFHQRLSKTDLYAKYKETHPKCDCSYCDGMVRHPYVVVRPGYEFVFNKERTCETCNLSYPDEYSFNTHVTVIHEPKRFMHECKFCVKKFKMEHDLTVHLKTHETDDKPYKCALCDYKARDLKNLRDHSLCHNFTSVGN